MKKKLCKTLIISLAMFSILSLGGCTGKDGATTGKEGTGQTENLKDLSAEEVGVNFLKQLFNKDLQEKGINLIKPYAHSSVSDTELQEVVELMNIAKEIKESYLYTFKEVKGKDIYKQAEAEIDKLVDSILGAIKIEKVDEKKVDNQIEIKYDISVPTVDDEKMVSGINDKLTKETDKIKTEDLTREKIEELQYKIAVDTITELRETIKTGNSSEKTDITLVMEKEKGQFKVIETY